MLFLEHLHSRLEAYRLEGTSKIASGVWSAPGAFFWVKAKGVGGAGGVSAVGSPGPYTHILDTLADIMFFRITPGCRGKCWDTPARNLGSNETGTAASRHDTKLSRIWWESLTGAT